MVVLNLILDPLKNNYALKSFGIWEYLKNVACVQKVRCFGWSSLIVVHWASASAWVHRGADPPTTSAVRMVAP